jgi:monoamine oxidase
MLESQNRRTFLSRFAVMSAGALMPWGSAFGGGRPSPQGKVLVAGGGFAGLYAADLLLARGFDVHLLEAGERLGGKAFGGNVGKHAYDFGCQAFSKDMTRVKALGQRFGLNVAPRPKQDAFYLEGDTVISGEPLEVLHKDFDAIEALGQSMYSQCDDPAQRPALASQSVLDWARPHLHPETLQYFTSSFAGEWCALPEEVSLLHYLEYQRGYDAEGEEMDFRYREGLFRAAEGLAKGLEGRYTLRAPLESVELSKHGVRAVAAGRTYDADYLICAIPMSKLRAIPISGADTTELAGSLESVASAAVRKIIAVYDQPFWGDKPREGAIDLPCGVALMDNSDMQAKRYSLAIFLGGPAALENPGRDVVLARIAKVVGEDALRPIAYHEQAWLGDEFLCGGYAMNRVPTRGSAAQIPLSVGGRLFIAGSEAAREFPSYVEGALFSAETAVLGIAKVRALAQLG